MPQPSLPLFCQRWLTAGFSGLLMWFSPNAVISYYVMIIVAQLVVQIWGILDLYFMFLDLEKHFAWYLLKFLILWQLEPYQWSTESSLLEMVKVRSISDQKPAVCQLWQCEGRLGWGDVFLVFCSFFGQKNFLGKIINLISYFVAFAFSKIAFDFMIDNLDSCFSFHLCKISW